MAKDSGNITDLTDQIAKALEENEKEIAEGRYKFTDEDWIPGSVQTGGNGVSSVGGHGQEGDWDNDTHGHGSTVSALSTMAFADDSSQAMLVSMPTGTGRGCGLVTVMSLSAACSLQLEADGTMMFSALSVESPNAPEERHDADIEAGITEGVAIAARTISELDNLLTQMGVE